MRHAAEGLRGWCKHSLMSGACVSIPKRIHCQQHATWQQSQQQRPTHHFSPAFADMQVPESHAWEMVMSDTTHRSVPHEGVVPCPGIVYDLLLTSEPGPQT